MVEQRNAVVDAARRHGLSEGAGEALFAALVRGGGGQAQFSHPDLGGMGQWSGGMTQIGDMFNDALKAKVAGFCGEMSEAARGARSGAGTSMHQRQSSGDARGVAPAHRSPWAVDDAPGDSWGPGDSWWPRNLGFPASSGSQNGMSYACFPDQRRLALLRDGTVTVYDTGDHRLNGFGQQQGTTGSITFSGQYGPVSLDSLTAVRG